MSIFLIITFNNRYIELVFTPKNFTILGNQTI